MLRNLNPYLRSAIVAIIFAMFCAAGMYFRQTLIDHQPFEPNWLILGGAAALFFLVDVLRVRMDR